MRLPKELLKIYLLFISLFFLGRLGLYLVHFGRMADIGLPESLMAFPVGLRMDTMGVSVLLLVPALLLAAAPRALARPAGRLVDGYVLACLLLALFVEIATFPFVAEYDVRPNYLFVEYLNYPREVSSMLVKRYPLEIAFAVLALGAAAWGFLRYSPLRSREAIDTPLWRRLLLLPFVAFLLFAGMRSTLGHRPANISDALYSTNRMANEVAKNSLYSIGYAYYSYSKEAGHLLSSYGRMPAAEAYARVSRSLNIPLGDGLPFHRTEATRFPAPRPRNLVIFIQESLGSQFVAFSGGEAGITPRMEALAEEGLAFTNLYCAGTRSIRGLAALTSGFLANPGEGVVKRNKSQSGFFTVASLLKPLGYRSSFLYGGEARFDNMRSWYLGNGFDEVVEQKDFHDPGFVSTWGVSDEDLVVLAHERFKAHAAKGERFVSVLFSSSNHSPFELPAGKIELLAGEPPQSVKNAVKYADFAVGRLFDLARSEPYFKETVFVVAADHNVGVAGEGIVPVHMFHVPAFIVADGLTPQRWDSLASQPDVLATALDLIGVDLAHPILGHSVFSEAHREVALMMFNDTYALLEGGRAAVVQPHKPAQTYRYAGKRLAAAPHDLELEKDALAYITVLDDLYDTRRFRTSP